MAPQPQTGFGVGAGAIGDCPQWQTPLQPQLADGPAALQLHVGPHPQVPPWFGGGSIIKIGSVEAAESVETTGSVETAGSVATAGCTLGFWLLYPYGAAALSLTLNVFLDSVT